MLRVMLKFYFSVKRIRYITLVQTTDFLFWLTELTVAPILLLSDVILMWIMYFSMFVVGTLVWHIGIITFISLEYSGVRNWVE